MLKKFQLKNGLNVLLMESHKSPVVSVQMWVRTGSADEQKGEEGISHFIEHLVFKGTEKFKVGEIASIVEGAGGELNAYTSFDQTVFYVTISKEFAETGLDVISQMMGFPAFDATEIDNEREVVIEEIKRGQDSPGRVASQLLFSTAYKKHPYGIPVIGFDKNIRKVSKKTLVNYYQSRYVPKNMFLVVSGDFQSVDMKKQVTDYFSKFVPYKLRNVKRKTEPKQTQPRIKTQKVPFSENFCYLTWKIPKIDHKDIPALDLLSMVLGSGDTSRLVKKLRIDEAIVKSVGASSFTPKDNGLFLVSFDAPFENYPKALDVIHEEIIGVLNHPPSQEEINRAITQIESDQFYSMETVDGLSRQMGHYHFYMNDVQYFKKYLAQIYKIKPIDLQKVAKKYFAKASFVSTAISKEHSKDIEKLVKNWLIKFDSEMKKTKISISKQKAKSRKKIAWDPTKTIHKKTETIKKVLPNGMTILLRHSSETPVIAARAAFLGGVRAEGELLEGTSELFSRTWTSGTSKLTEEQISTQVEDMAAGLGAFAGRNTVGLSLEVLKPFESEAADLFSEVLTNSLWPSAIVDREKIIQKEQIKSKSENPTQIAVSLFMNEMFKNHPYQRDILGQLDQIQNIQQKHMSEYWNRIGNTQNLSLIVTGNFDTQVWEKQIDQISKNMKKGKKFDQSFPVQKLKSDKHIFQKIEREQSHIIVGYRGLTLTDEERYTLHIMESILSGQGGRLFIELRDKKSLAYSVSPIRMEGLDCGYFGGYIGCSPEKSATAIRMLKEQFQRLTEESVDAKELDRAQRYLIGRHDIDLQKARSIGSSILFDDIYGIDFNETFKASEKYRQINSAQIQKLAQKIFAQPSIVTLVGKEDVAS